VFVVGAACAPAMSFSASKIVMPIARAKEEAANDLLYKFLSILGK